MAYFITDNNTSKGRDPNINIINSIHEIKGRTSVNILVSNYTKKHLTFHKGEYVGHLEPAVIDNTTIDQKETHQTHSITLQKMMAEQVKPDFSMHHAINCLPTFKMTLMHCWKNMNHNLQRTKHRSELHLSPA